jgi:hypothetical protein
VVVGDYSWYLYEHREGAYATAELTWQDLMLQAVEKSIPASRNLACA